MNTNDAISMVFWKVLPERWLRSESALVLIGATMFSIIHLLVLPFYVDISANIVFICVNSLAFYCGLNVHKEFCGRRTVAYIAGYAFLAVLFFCVVKSPLLFAAFGFLYAACFRNWLLLGFVCILIFSIVFLPPYWMQTTVLLSILYAVGLRIYPQREKRFFLIMFSFGFILIISISLPLLYLILNTTPQTLMVSASDSMFHQALLTSAATATLSTSLVTIVGLPLAYALSRLDFWGKGFIDSLIDLPIVVPQSVAGIALLVIMGPKAPLGAFMKSSLGIDIAGSYLGIIICQVFVSCPFLVRSAMNAFQETGPRLEHVSRTLGASPLNTFFRVTLPLASSAIFNGCILTWSRAISEVGSLMVLAYHPFTVSIFTYDQFVQYGLHEAQPISVLLILICLWSFFVLRWLRTVPLGPAFMRLTRRETR